MLNWFRRRRYDAIVVSPGGAGTTFLLQFIEKHLRVNNSNSYFDGIKHANSPRHPVLEHLVIPRALYLYEDPKIIALSLFGRGYQSHMIPKLNALHGSPREYRNNLKKHRVDIDFQTFVAGGRDLFGLTTHLHNWILGPEEPPFPVLGVKYTSLFQELSTVFEFLGLPPELIEDFPVEKERSSKLDGMDASQRAGLETMYDTLSQKYAGLPGIVLRQPGAFSAIGEGGRGYWAARTRTDDGVPRT